MKFFKILGLMSLLIFSFYLTDFVSELAINSDELMKDIKLTSDDYYVNSVNAYIEDNTIIPGIKGKKVNFMESYLNMKDFGAFNINYLIYDSIIPDISIDNNKDKIIISGNKLKREVSILIKENKDILKYSEDNNIMYTKLINDKYNINNKENININNNKKDFLNLDTILNKNNLNKKICILNYSNIEVCKNKKYYIIKPNIEIKNNNLTELNNINNGSIILIDNNLNISNYQLILDYLKNKDIEIVYLSKLIEE